MFGFVVPSASLASVTSRFAFKSSSSTLLFPPRLHTVHTHLRTYSPPPPSLCPLLYLCLSLLMQRCTSRSCLWRTSPIDTLRQRPLVPLWWAHIYAYKFTYVRVFISCGSQSSLFMKLVHLKYIYILSLMHFSSHSQFYMEGPFCLLDGRLNCGTALLVVHSARLSGYSSRGMSREKTAFPFGVRYRQGE